MSEGNKRVAEYFKRRPVLEAEPNDLQQVHVLVGGTLPGHTGHSLTNLYFQDCDTESIHDVVHLPVASEWEAGLRAAMEVAAARREEALRIQKLEQDVEDLKKKIDQRWSITVPVASLAPEPFELIKKIPVVVQPSGDEYIASFFDANINTSGCTETDAVANLKELMIAIFDHLSAMEPGKLGPGPRKQLAVLNGFIRRQSQNG